MNIALWVVQGLLAFAFFMAGSVKLLKSKAEVQEKMNWAEDFSQTQLRMIGGVEVLGALGLVLPLLLDVLPILTPFAGVGLALTMAVAIATHLRRKESITPNLVLLGLALFVVVGRFMLLPVIS